MSAVTNKEQLLTYDVVKLGRAMRDDQRVREIVQSRFDEADFLQVLRQTPFIAEVFDRVKWEECFEIPDGLRFAARPDYLEIIDQLLLFQSIPIEGDAEKSATLFVMPEGLSYEIARALVPKKGRKLEMEEVAAEYTQAMRSSPTGDSYMCLITTDVMMGTLDESRDEQEGLLKATECRDATRLSTLLEAFTASALHLAAGHAPLFPNPMFTRCSDLDDVVFGAWRAQRAERTDSGACIQYGRDIEPDVGAAAVVAIRSLVIASVKAAGRDRA